MIEELDGKMKYEQIIQHVQSLASFYNQNLENRYKNFKSEIENHNESLQENIKEYIQKINKGLKDHSSCVQKFIESITNIESQITKFDKNYSHFHKSRDYIIWYNLIKLPGANSGNRGVTREEISIISKISDSMLEYINASRSFNFKKSTLSTIMKQLKHYSSQFVGKTVDYQPSKGGSNIVDSVLNPLEKIKFHLDQFEKNIQYVKKLEKIGGYIKDMKDALEKVQGKVKEEVKNYIQGLSDISIKKEDVERDIKTIKSVNKVIIDKLKIAKHTIDFYKSLDDELDNLNDVTFDTYYYRNNIDYLERYLLVIKGKVESFGCAIKPKLCEAKNQIETFKQQIQKSAKDAVTCGGKTVEQQDDDPITKAKINIDGPVSEIKSFIDNSLNDINQIKDLLRVTENRKNQSETYINDIKSKVDGITRLSDAKTKLPQAVEDLKNFVKVQEDTRDLIEGFKSYDKFTTLSQFSTPLEQIISLSHRLIEDINKSMEFLKTVDYTNGIVIWIKRYYESRFEIIKGIIHNFKGYVEVIIGRVEEINYNLCLIKTLFSQISVEKNLLKLKEYMRYLKFYVRNIRENFNVISTIIDKIKKESRHIDTHKRVYERLEKYIHCYICYIKQNYSNVLKEKIEKDLEEIKDRLNGTIRIMILIDSFKSLESINKIESKLICVESSIDKLECAIEGVARNLIRCSLLSLKTNIRVSKTITKEWKLSTRN